MRREAPARGGRDMSHMSANEAGNLKDHRSDWHHDQFIRRPHRISLSPSSRDRHPRSPPIRRSSSTDRRDYASRRPDYGKQLHNDPTSTPHRRYLHSPNQREGYELPHRFMLSNDSNLKPELSSNPKMSHMIEDEEYLLNDNGLPGASHLGLETQSMLYQKRLIWDDGSPQTFYSLPEDANFSTEAALLKQEYTGRNRVPLDVGFRDYHDRLRNPFDERHGVKAYTSDASFATTPSLRSYGGASSSNLSKNDMLSLYDDHPHQPSDGYLRDGSNKYINDTFDRIGYVQMQISEPLRRNPLSPAQMDPQYFEPDGFSQRELSNRRFLVSDEIYEKIPWRSHSDHHDKMGSSFRDRVGGRIGELDASRNVTSESGHWDKQYYLHEDAELEYQEVKNIKADFLEGSSSGHTSGYKIKPSRVHELATVEGTYALRSVAGLNSYNERPTSPTYYGRRVNVYGQVIKSPQREADMYDLYELPSERITRKQFVSDVRISEPDPRSLVSNNQTAFRSISSAGATGNMWSERRDEQQEVMQSKRMAIGHSKYKTVSHRVSRSDNWPTAGETLRHPKHGHGTNIKKRLRSGPSEAHGSYNSERRQEFFKSHKSWKKDLEERNEGPAHDRYVSDDTRTQRKRDPVEGSEEFKQQVHKSFLRFLKLLNEDMQQLKRYREQGNESHLCCICGSTSEKFPDTHSLVSHFYHSGKVGLKTEHLGLHKALCLLMGWNWLVAPDQARTYQSAAAPEAKNLKEDLILWPPVVIFHNNSTGKKTLNNKNTVLSTEGIQEILRELGFEVLKTTICKGNPSNQSVFSIKFFPTFSGLQEAERLHKRLAENHHGRQDFLQRSSSKNNPTNEGEACFKKFPSLYGYMAIAEDLPKLDSETMKRCMVKSKKDIEAIADAPLNLD
ncbi:uncharacterized protein LOC122022604 [Zingiber officinale]|uniref:XS domain-containing protein n=1 Tax=Zingiber officinale TaxID=94328 RepID=A0A8J5F3N1_ZINOF|nr:uncharacterized protein LOC122022604 [Zingiber officinale]KAG6477628.1 hypothetical protein ZIOFF_066896 [Zingiber officinale]